MKEKKELINNELEQVNGGSWFITENEGRRAGLSLRNDDGTEGSWGNIWNTGNYWWHGREVTRHEANCIARFTTAHGHQPISAEEAVAYCKKKRNIVNEFYR